MYASDLGKMISNFLLELWGYSSIQRGEYQNLLVPIEQMKKAESVP